MQRPASRRRSRLWTRSFPPCSAHVDVFSNAGIVIGSPIVRDDARRLALGDRRSQTMRLIIRSKAFWVVERFEAGMWCSRPLGWCPMPDSAYSVTKYRVVGLADAGPRVTADEHWVSVLCDGRQGQSGCDSRRIRGAAAVLNDRIAGHSLQDDKHRRRRYMRRCDWRLPLRHRMRPRALRSAAGSGT